MIHGLYFEAYYTGFVSGHLKKQTNKKKTYYSSPQRERQNRCGQASHRVKGKW